MGSDLCSWSPFLRGMARAAPHGPASRLAAILAALLVMVAMPLTLPPASAAVAPVIDLQFGEGHGHPFSIEGIAPGDLGSKSVVLRNAGTSDGQLAIWISDIRETDGSVDGAHLDDYLLFEVRAEGLSSNLLMPCLVRSFPSTAFGDGYVWVLNVRAGQELALTWNWQFEETYQQQNAAQGDGLSFTINYLLGDMPPPSLGMSWMRIEVLGQVTLALMDAEDRTAYDVMALAPNGLAAVILDKGTKCASPSGSPVSSITLTKTATVHPVPTGLAVIGPGFRLGANCSEGELMDDFVDRPLGLRLNYDPGLLPSITRMVGLYAYEGGGTWQPLPPPAEAPSYIGQCMGQTSGAGEVAVLATYDPQESAYLLPSDLSIEPSQSVFWDPIVFVKRVGDTVRVSVVLTNIGEVPGSGNVSLAIDGREVSMEQVRLDPLERREVVFTVRGLEEGTHELQLAGLSGQVIVGTSVNWWLVLFFATMSIATVAAISYSASRWSEMRRRLIWLQGNVLDVEAKLLESEMAKVAMRERQKPRAEERASQLPETPSHPVLSTITEPPIPGVERTTGSDTLSEELKDMFEVVPPASTEGEASHLADTHPRAPEGVPIIEPGLGEGANPAPMAPTPAVVDLLLRQEQIDAKKLQLAKGFILATIEEKGRLTLDHVPRSRNADIAMMALSQLIEEGKIRAIQQQHMVIFLAIR